MQERLVAVYEVPGPEAEALVSAAQTRRGELEIWWTSAVPPPQPRR